jgi:SP family myo-inositol transporter-like MFS transporter 13
VIYALLQHGQVACWLHCFVAVIFDFLCGAREFHYSPCTCITNSSSTGVISSTLVSIAPTDLARPLTTLDKGLITSSTSFFALVASPLTGLLADSTGRKPVILLASLLFILGALLQAFSHTVSMMILGRSVVGLAVGSASFVVPLYISELSPSPFRGRLVTVSSLFITGGQVVAYIIGWAFSDTASGWRWMVGLGAAPAAVQLVLLAGMPETPRFLVQKGRVAAGRAVLARVYGAGPGMHGLVSAVLRRVEREILEEEGLAGPAAKSQGGWKARAKHVSDQFGQLVAVGPNRRALTIACMLQGFQQLCGFNRCVATIPARPIPPRAYLGQCILKFTPANEHSLMYFSATIFRLVGFRSPTLTSLSIALTNFAFTLVAFWCIDRVGRRRILLLSVPVMIVGLALCALAFGFIDLSTEEGASNVLLRAAGQESRVWPLIILLAMVLYVASYAVGLGCVPWQQSELFPLSVRALGSALATSANWASNTVVGLTFLPMMEFLTPTGTFVCYAAVCAVCWVTVWKIYPETAGLSLEDVGGLLRDGYGVAESVSRFKSRRLER